MAANANTVRISHRLGAQADRENIADDAAQPRAGAAVRLKRGGVIVCFGLEGDAPFIVDCDDAGVKTITLTRRAASSGHSRAAHDGGL